MKRLLTLAICCMIALPALCQKNEKPFVIPELRQWTAAEGAKTLTSKSSLCVSKDQKEQLLPIARQFAADLKTMFDIEVGIKVGKPSKQDIGFTVATGTVAKGNREGYSINIEANQPIQIVANEPIGALWATRTLLQIMEQSRSRQIPCGAIEDYPAYPVRGFMLDVGRKFFSLDYLKNVVKIMSYYKMNTFQVHLNDNGFKEFFDNDWAKTPSGFRLESTTYPGLASKDGHYKKDEFRQFQIDALAQGVTIVPEIDAPAHTLAFAHYNPELGSTKYGLDHLDLFNPKTYEFMDGLFKEYLEGENPVFVNEYVHIGTDEYSNKDQTVVEKFRYFTDRYIKYVESFGKKAALWGALTHAKGETPVKVDNVLMWCWYNGYAQPRDMMSLGYDVISIPDGYLYIVPAAGYYYDYLNIKHLYNNWTPANIGSETFEDDHKQIKGGIFAVWNDHCGNGISYQDVHHRLMPAMQTLAVKLWDGKNATLTFEQFNSLRKAISEAPGVNLLARPAAGRIGYLFNVDKATAGQKMPMSDIGYNYRVEFDLTAGKNDKGTKLFESDNSVFYLADPKEGKLGYSRDGYDYRFNYSVPQGKKVNLAIEGTQKSTKLFVDGQLVESLDVVLHPSSSDKKKMYWVQTLVFPLDHVGQFDGTIENLKVTAL